MKLITLSLLMLFTLSIQAQTKPQKVYSIIKVRHTLEWYQEQLALWEEEVKNDPKNAEAWLNVYTATRMVKLTGGPKTQKDMDAIVEKVNTNIPGTFESNFMTYSNEYRIYSEGYREKNMSKYVMEAYRLGPDRIEIFDLIVMYYMLKEDERETKRMCEQWLASGHISEGIFATNYNFLVSCEKNAILFTAGDNDTFPAWVLQYAKNIRTDVTVLNMSLLCRKDWMDMWFKKLGIPEYKPEKENMDYNASSQAICAHITKYTKRPVYYVNGIDFGDNNIKDSLYSVGIVNKYSTERFDNIAVLRKNVERNYLKDYILVNFENDISESVVNDFNSNYLVPFLTLYFHYRDSGDTSNLETMYNLIKVIAERSGVTEEVNNIIKQGKL